MTSSQLQLPTESPLMESLSLEDWERAKRTIRDFPVLASKAGEVSQFLGSDKMGRVIPLHQACAHKAPLDVVQMIYDRHPESTLSQDSVYKRLPLHVALMSSASQNVLEALLDWDPCTSQAHDILGRFPLHYACNHDAPVEIIERLVALNPDAAAKSDVNGWLPLHVACRFGMPVSVIRLLCESCPASIHQTTSKGSTPLVCARRSNNQEILDFLELQQKQTPKDTPLPCEQGSPSQEHKIPYIDLEPLSPPSSPSSSTVRVSVSTAVVHPRTAPSEVSSLSVSPTTNGSGRNARAVRPLNKEDLARLAFPVHSPYLEGKQRRIPFLSKKLGM